MRISLVAVFLLLAAGTTLFVLLFLQSGTGFSHSLFPENPVTVPHNFPPLPSKPPAPEITFVSTRSSFEARNPDNNAITISYAGSRMEHLLHAGVNAEREKNNLQPLAWNESVAAIAREHSHTLAAENEQFLDFSFACPEVFIHHEGFDFGDYHDDRLRQRGFVQFVQSGENIAAQFLAGKRWFTGTAEPCVPHDLSQEELHALPSDAARLQAVREEITARIQRAESAVSRDWDNIEWDTEEGIAHGIVQGWMNSPGHRKNILTPEFAEAGMGVSFVQGYVIATQVFIGKTSEQSIVLGPSASTLLLEGYADANYAGPLPTQLSISASRPVELVLARSATHITTSDADFDPYAQCERKTIFSQPACRVFRSEQDGETAYTIIHDRDVLSESTQETRSFDFSSGSCRVPGCVLAVTNSSKESAHVAIQLVH